MAIERKIVYISSDGSDHDTPQEAAAWDLADALEDIVKRGGYGDPEDELDDIAWELARNPEALRDAINAYFEDLEDHPNVDSLEDGEIAPGVRGFEMSVAAGAFVPADAGELDAVGFDTEGQMYELPRPPHPDAIWLAHHVRDSDWPQWSNGQPPRKYVYRTGLVPKGFDFVAVPSLDGQGPVFNRDQIEDARDWLREE